jgi:SPP1 family predicted phage head-tail adaptor
MNREGKKSLASEARHYIIIQTITQTSDGEGGFTDTWTDSSTISAAIYPIKAEQQFKYKSLNVEATHYVKIRGDLVITEKNRIKFRARFFEILTVENIQERGIEKFLVCKEVV